MTDAVLDGIARNDLDGVAAALAGLTEAQRKAVWKGLPFRFACRPVEVLAVLGTAPGARRAADDLAILRLSDDEEALAVEVLAERRPAWLPALAAALVEPGSWRDWGWRVVRGLVRRGVMPRPDDPHHVEAMVYRLVPWNREEHRVHTVLDGLRADPGLLEDDVWALFTAGRTGGALLAHDNWCDHPRENHHQKPVEPRAQDTWRHALVTLTAEGMLDRARLLDADLAAMLADRAPADLTWFATFHGALNPSDDELAARRDTYLRLPSSEAGHVTRLGLQVLGRLLRNHVVTPGEVARAVTPTLTRPEKGVALAALRLLERDAPDDPAALAEALATGYDHPSADVRERAAAVAARWPAAAATLGPSGAAAPEPPQRPVAHPLVFDPMPTDPWPVPAPVHPVADADELVELFAHLLEEADDPVEVERALDGAARFADVAPRHGAQALVARALQVVSTFPGPWVGWDLRHDLAAVALCALDRRAVIDGPRGRLVRYREDPRSPSGVAPLNAYVPDWRLPSLVTLRAYEVARATRTGARPLLSLPATADGAIPAAALNERLAVARAANPLDLGLAILRVPPAEYDELRLPDRGLALDALTALRSYAPAWTRVVGLSRDEWSRPTRPMVVWGDPASPRGDVDRLVPAVLDRRDPLPLAAVEAQGGENSPRAEQLTALWPLMLPHHLDLLAAHAHPRLFRALTKNRSGGAPLVAAIGASSQRGGAPTASALALALAAREVPVRIAAIDALVARADRGLVDASVLAEQVGLLLADDIVIGTRIVDTLAEAARASDAAATATLRVLARLAPAVAGRREAHRWIDLLADLSRRLSLPVALPPTLRALATGGESTALARACRRVPTPD